MKYLFALALLGCAHAEALPKLEHCRSERFTLINHTKEWTERDAEQLEESELECGLRYDKCLLLFKKYDFQSYTIICGE
jgi:hypothetical protein